MPDLEMLLRDVRPVPDGAWAARLDARVAARFPGPVPRWKAALITARHHILAIGAVGAVASLLVVIIAVGVSSDSGFNSDSGAKLAAPAAKVETGASSDSAGLSTRSAKPSEGASTATQFPQALSAAPPTTQARIVRKDASLTLACTPAQVETVTDRAIRVVDGLGGFVKTSEINSSGSDAGSTLSLQVPTARLDTALAQLSRLAHVKGRSQQSEDLTDQKAALEAAVRDARADREGLRVRLAKAANDKERSRLRAQLDAASRLVTRRERDVANLGREVAFATIQLDIEGTRRSGAAPVKPGDHWTPADALHDAGRVLEVIAGVLVIGLAILLPVGVIAVLIGLASRIFIRRQRERALEMA